MSEWRDWGETAAAWWRAYAKPQEGHRAGAGRAALARLRRATTAIEALMEPAAIDLARRLAMVKPRQLARVGILAAVLAHVREEDERPVARAAGPENPSNDPKDYDQTAVLKYGRFKRLLQSDEDELIDAMRRLVHLLENKVNVADLARAILWWNEETRQRWVFEYYGLEREHKPTAAEATPPAAASS